MTTQAEIVRYRVERAQDSLREARLLADGGLWSACVNRLYYACFYAVSALLLSRGLSSSKHTGVRSLFNSNFVKTEEVSRELGAVYNDLFENRQKSDYMDFVRFDEDQVRPWIVDAQLFVATIGALAVVAEESDQERATKD
ncbi:MAG TPA: HEPN domain-containing protein [Thermoanaerobaculia bacterium]